MKIASLPHKITLVVTSVDMRCGFDSLSRLAEVGLNIQVSQRKDALVFLSKSRAICKIIWADEHGSAMVTRKLNQGRFQQLLSRAEGPATEPLTIGELELFLDGKPIRIKRQSMVFG